MILKYSMWLTFQKTKNHTEMAFFVRDEKKPEKEKSTKGRFYDLLIVQRYYSKSDLKEACILCSITFFP